MKTLAKRDVLYIDGEAHLVSERRFVRGVLYYRLIRRGFVSTVRHDAIVQGVARRQVSVARNTVRSHLRLVVSN